MHSTSKFEILTDESTRSPFVQLLWKHNDHAQVGILDTAVFGSDGKLKQWFFSNKKLKVMKKHAHNTSVFTLEHNFISNGPNGKSYLISIEKEL
jgi:hypothetical protein